MSPQLALPPISPKGHFCDNCGSSFGDRGTSKGAKGEIETKPCYSVHFSVAPVSRRFVDFLGFWFLLIYRSKIAPVLIEMKFWNEIIINAWNFEFLDLPQVQRVHYGRLQKRRAFAAGLHQKVMSVEIVQYNTESQLDLIFSEKKRVFYMNYGHKYNPLDLPLVIVFCDE